MCNSLNDCADGSDEDFTERGPCNKREASRCSVDEFRCTHTHICISNAYVCDKDLDCGQDDESDEIGCYTNSTSDVTPDMEFSCARNASLLCEHNCTDISKLNGLVKVFVCWPMA